MIANTAITGSVADLAQFRPGDGFRIKAFEVSVDGYGSGTIYAASRGKAIAEAWRSDAFNAVSFRDFLPMVRAVKTRGGEGFGLPITVSGKPAFLIERGGHYVRFAYQGSDTILNSHPLDVSPSDLARAPNDRSDKLGEGAGRQIHEQEIDVARA